MEPQSSVNQAPTERQKSQLHQVTPLSKYLAMALFIILPFLGGWIGYKFAPEKVLEVERNVNNSTTTHDNRQSLLSDRLQLIGSIESADERVIDVAYDGILTYNEVQSTVTLRNISDKKEVTFPLAYTYTPWGLIYRDFVVISEFGACEVDCFTNTFAHGTTTILRRSDGAVLQTIAYSGPIDAKLKFTPPQYLRGVSPGMK